MSKLLSVRQICEEALQVIGAFPVTEDAADPADMARALRWFDKELAEIGGTERLFWLEPATLEISVTGGTRTYDLASLALNTGGVQFPISAVLVRSTTDRTPLTFVSREAYEEIGDPARTGDPTTVYVDRLAQTLTIWPVPASGIDDRKVRLVHQRYPIDATDPNSGNQPHGLPASWQKMMTFRLAVAIGSGPVRKCTAQQLSGWDAMATRSENALKAYENRLHADIPISDIVDI